VDTAVAAMREAKWSPKVLKRRLAVFDMRTRGLPMDEIQKRIVPSVTERQLWYDWREIRIVLGAVAAPQLEEVISRAEARLEHLFSMTMAEIRRRSDRSGGEVSARLLTEARRIVRELCYLRGAIKPYAVAVAVGAPGQEAGELGRRSDEELRELAAKERDALAALIGENGSRHG
jgi:hypothetical protein